ncbi:hypothetical protein WN944_026303 [Citrus x changshan-huyou]|uniref:Uncharacterized protein n=1 Tax=Citrus x changshan-huyou TaxID=2935761 RepID=A0AAP0QDT3_9ROSI
MTNDENNTALHEAVCHGNVQVVKIRTGQDPDYPYSANNYGKTQLYLAAKGRYSEMVIELLENSTSVSYEGPNGKTALHAAAMHFYYDKAAFQKLLDKNKGLIQKKTNRGGLQFITLHFMININ